jgi:hypothetical protein
MRYGFWEGCPSAAKPWLVIRTFHKVNFCVGKLEIGTFLAKVLFVFSGYSMV